MEFENVPNAKKNFMRVYNNDEIQSMNFIFGKNAQNNWFTREELVFANNFDLSNKANLEKAKSDWILSYFD